MFILLFIYLFIYLFWVAEEMKENCRQIDLNVDSNPLLTFMNTNGHNVRIPSPKRADWGLSLPMYTDALWPFYSVCHLLPKAPGHKYGFKFSQDFTTYVSKLLIHLEFIKCIALSLPVFSSFTYVYVETKVKIRLFFLKFF